MAVCPQCHKTIDHPVQGAAFCPFCGGRLETEQENAYSPQQLAEIRRQLQSLDGSSDPKKRYTQLKELETLYPESLDVALELLMLGRLHERNPKNVDFSVIKSYLLQMYLTPELFDDEKKMQMRQELFSHPQVRRCIELSGDEDGFLNNYLTRLSEEFIGLFLRGSSRYMHNIFGFTSQSRAHKLLAGPAGEMLRRMQADAGLTDRQRMLLERAFYRAFAKTMDTEFLDAELGELAPLMKNEW